MELARAVTDPGCAVADCYRACTAILPESPLAGIARALSGSRVMQAIEAGIERQTGKPLPPVVVKTSGKPPRSVPYSALLTGVLLKRVILRVPAC